MGPYCNYCGNRCFVHLPMKTPPHIVQAYHRERPITIIATCSGGQRLEKQRIGYCYDDIKAAIKAQTSRLEGESDGE